MTQQVTGGVKSYRNKRGVAGMVRGRGGRGASKVVTWGEIGFQGQTRK